MNNEAYPKFGDIYFADLKADGHAQGGSRPVVIAQNDVGNMHSPMVEILPMTSQVSKFRRKRMPTQVEVIANDQNGLLFDSVVIGEQVTTINKEQLKKYIGHLEYEDLLAIGRARFVQSPFPT